MSESVFQRMRQERSRVASQLRAEGAETAALIESTAERERTVILAEAYRMRKSSVAKATRLRLRRMPTLTTRIPSFIHFLAASMHTVILSAMEATCWCWIPTASFSGT